MRFRPLGTGQLGANNSVSSTLTLSCLLCCRADELCAPVQCQHNALVNALHSAVRTFLEECILTLPF